VARAITMLQRTRREVDGVGLRCGHDL
jgi:hypothetical protein